MINIKNICKEIPDAFGKKKLLFKDISFDIPEKKITTLITPDYSDVSMLLKCIAGLEDLTSGTIINSSSGMIGYIPSLPSSFPWLNVEQNIKIGKKVIPGKNVSSSINIVGLGGYEKYHPNNTSIGFRFRISLARVLAQNPSLIILDNPYKLLKPEIRNEILNIVKEINKSYGTSFLITTNEISEALTLADNILVIKKEPAEVIIFQIPNIPFTENWINSNLAEYLKYKNTIELSLRESDLNR